MPLILKNKIDRAVAQLARAGALRSTDEVINQLQMQVRDLTEQLRAADEQHDFTVAHYEAELRMLLRDLAEVKYELARRDTRDAFAAAPSPSAKVH